MTTTEEQLRATLRRHADDAGTPTGVYDTVLDRHRRGRRRHVMGAAATACALVIVAVPVTQSVLDPGPDPGGVAGPVERYPLPPRGSLAGDEDFLAEVLRAPWGNAGGALIPPLDTRQVVYAGEVAGRRWARVVGVVDGELAGAWLSGPSGAAGDSLTLRSEPHTLVPGPEVFYEYSDGTGVLLVVSEPGDRVAMSERPEIDAAGTVARDYRAVDAVDGIAVVDLPGEWLQALSVRIDRGSEMIYRGGGEGSAEFGPDDQPRTWTDQEISAAATGALGTAPNPDVARLVLDELTTHAGYAVDELGLSVLWAGPVGAPNDAQAVLISAVLPSGAIAVLGGHSLLNAHGLLTNGGVSLLQLHPIGTTPENLLLVMRCDLYEGSGRKLITSELVILGPTRSTSFRLAGQDRTVEGSGGGRTVSGQPADGVTSVQALDEAGTVLAEAPVSGVEDVTDRGDGPVN